MSDLWRDLYLRFWGYPHYMCSYGWPYPCRFHQIKAWFNGDAARWQEQEFKLWQWYEDRIVKLEKRLAPPEVCDVCGDQFSDLAGHKALGVQTHPWLLLGKTTDRRSGAPPTLPHGSGGPPEKDRDNADLSNGRDLA